ncbi:unnamed protein product [Auanema sp. JU1783]|nr:unnamed protein product [Auanema sp. JU1783]
MQTIDNLNEFWSEPVVNWFDYFVNRPKFQELLLDHKQNQDAIASLALQFCEQATFTEKEYEVMVQKSFPIEDLQFLQRKSACMWLCALSCLAALEWDFELLVEKQDILAVKPLMEYIEKLWQNREITTDPIFGEWLYARWILSIDRKYRVSVPPAKQIVNNPLQVQDLNLQRQENIRKVVQEARELRIFRVVEFMEKFISDESAIYVPGVLCFLQPFLEQSGQAMSVGIMGANVLIEGSPKPKLTNECIFIPAKDVLNKTAFELGCFFFSEGRLDRSFHLLSKVNINSTEHSLVTVTYDDLIGYVQALRIPASFPIENSPSGLSADQALLKDDNNVYRKRSLYRWKSELTCSASLQTTFRSENIARDIVEGKISLNRMYLKDKTIIEKFVKALTRFIPNLNASDTSRLQGILRFLSYSIPGLREEMIRNNLNEDFLCEQMQPTVEKTFAAPGLPILKALLSSEVPLWKILSSFDVGELKETVNSMKHFSLPRLLKFPELLGEYVLVGRPINDFHALLLGKMNQLARIGNHQDWQQFCNNTVTELGHLGVQNQVRFLLEALNVQSAILNEKLNVSFESFGTQLIQTHLKATKGFFANPQAVNIPNSHELCSQVLALCLNAKEWDFVISKLDLPVPIMTIVKLIAAFGQHGNNPGMKKLADAWTTQLTPSFENSRKRHSDGGSQRENFKMRIEIIKFLKFVKEPNLLPFLISFFAYMFNRVLLAERKPQLRIFVQHSELFGTETELPNAAIDAIEECLQIVLQNSFEVNPVNAFWLRTAADFKYAKGELEESATLYMETLLACKTSLTVPFPENVVDDLVWIRLRTCFSRASCHTLALLICQLLRNRKEEEYSKMTELLSSQASADATDECYSMIFDHILVESLSQTLDQSKQLNNLERLLYWCSKPSLNSNNRSEVHTREQCRRAERLIRVMAAQLFAVHL